MADRRTAKTAGAGEAERPPLTAEQFEQTVEFRRFKRAMKGLLKVSKAELDRKVELAKKTSPRVDNRNAPGRKAKLPK